RVTAPPNPGTPTATGEGLIAGVRPGVCQVYAQGVISTCRSMPGLAVGDLVRFDTTAVRQILPRRTTLSRPDPRNPRLERLLAVNVDIVVNVVSVSSPPLRPGLIDRYLVAIRRGGADPLICVNKSDLLQDARELDILDIYRDIGIPVVLCSAATGAGISDLMDTLTGLTCVFTGHSGVGKSSVLNAICPALALPIGEVSSGADRKGRHTTTSSSLHMLANGTKVIDTPGIRQFGLWEIGAGDLQAYFQEFERFALRCTYADCTHTHQPGCKVEEAVRAGDIAAERFASYRRIRETLLE
ncbi:MAG: ribosome small subunit-dependent GTPase A, partial [Bryobacteraceae bacterium]